MKKRYLSTAIVGVIFAGLLVYMFLGQRGRVAEEGEYFGMHAADISQIRVQAKDYSYTMVRRGEDWWITQPFEGLVSADAGKSLVEGVASLKAVGRPGKNLQDPAYGLDKPGVTVTVTYKGNRTTTIHLGQKSPLGDKIFATISDKPTTLFLVDQAFWSQVDQSPDKLREKRLAADVKLDNVKSITVQRPGEKTTAALVPLTQEPTWKITEPRPLKADKTAVEALLSAASSGEAADFMPYTQANLQATGLDQPQVVVSYTLEGAQPVTIYLGKQDKRPVPASAESPANSGPTEQDVVYATRRGRSEILVLPASLLADLNKGLLDLRDKHILDLKKEQITSLRVQRQQGLNFNLLKSGQAWQMTAPKTGPAQASKVDDLLYALMDLQAQAYPVENQAQVDLAKYGLTLPQATLTAGREGGQEITLSIGAAVPNQPDSYYLRTSLNNDVYQIDGSLLHDLPQTTDDLTGPPGASSAAPPPSGLPPGMPPGLPPPAAPGRP
jgi:hypothetical protein